MSAKQETTTAVGAVAEFLSSVVPAGVRIEKDVSTKASEDMPEGVKQKLVIDFSGASMERVLECAFSDRRIAWQAVRKTFESDKAFEDWAKKNPTVTVNFAERWNESRKPSKKGKRVADMSLEELQAELERRKAEKSE
jgi:hypothetical protein